MTPTINLHPNDTDEDYAYFGKIVLLWGQVEACLVTIIFHLIQPPNNLKNKGIPQSFGNRSILARKGYETLPRYAPLKDEATTIIDELQKLHELRTVFVHGLYNGKKIYNHYAFGLVKRGKNGDSFVVETHIYSMDELTGLIYAIGDVKDRLETILNKTVITPV